MNKTVQLVHKPYVEWVRIYQEASEKLRAILGSFITELHHIGSTSVAAMICKPTVDILGVVKDELSLQSHRARLEQEGFFWHIDNGVPGKINLTSQSPAPGIHIYLFPTGHSEIEKYLSFRDHLRDNPEACRTYEKLKTQLQREFANDPETYQAGKHELIQALLSQINLSKTRH
jgi:GrpB-like predicted nucleotidyltransferase (UPF0157 family)